MRYAHESWQGPHRSMLYSIYTLNFPPYIVLYIQLYLQSDPIPDIHIMIIAIGT